MNTTQDAFNELYKQIDFNNQPYGVDQDHIKWIKSKINREIATHLQPGKTLDAGGGYGYLKNFLSEDQIYFNLEYSKEIQKWDKSEYKVIGSGLQLPYRDNTFENVVSGDVLEHVPDKKQYLKESYRVLKENGIFVINTPTIGSPAQRFYASLWYYLFFFGAFLQKVFHKIFNKPQEYTDLDVPEGILDEPSDEKWLYSTLNEVGYKVFFGRRTAPHLPFGLDGKFWRKIVDNFIGEEYGNSMLFVCKKDMNNTKSKSFESLGIIPIDRGYFCKKLGKVTKKLVRALNIDI